MNRLKFLRTEREESLEKIAKFLHVTLQTISNYENERRDMSPETIIKLAEYFNVSTDYLLGKSDIRNPEELKKISFANNKGLDTNGLNQRDIEELQAQIEFKRKYNKKNNENK